MPTPTLPFAQRVQEQHFGDVHLYTLATDVKEVVSWRGSFQTQPAFSQGDDLLQFLTVSLLDKGTLHRDRFAIAETLEDCGAQLGFSSDGRRVRVHGRALREDVPTILNLLAELLREPLFSEAEFDKARAQLEAGLRRSVEHTRAQASAALAHHLYPAQHPNHDEGLVAQLAHLASLSVDDVRQYHARQFGANAYTMTFAGDVSPDVLAQTIDSTLGDWPTQVLALDPILAPATVPIHSQVPMPNKSNVDVHLGQVLPFMRTHQDFIPLYVGNFVLGGNFSSRLMAVIRDELGLTYGIHASLSGFAPAHNGHWLIDVTLSQDGVEKGTAATLAELHHFVDAGITQTELETAQRTLTGSFQVGLATTTGLANSLQINIERGFGPAYLDDFPQKVKALELAEVNEVIQRYLDPNQLHHAVAGIPPDL